MDSQHAPADWREAVTQLILKHEEETGDTEGHARVLNYLVIEETSYRFKEVDGATISPCWRVLKSSMNSPTMFNAYLCRLIEDTKTLERNESYREYMNALYENMLNVDDNPLPESALLSLDENQLLLLSYVASSLPTLVQMIPKSTWKQLTLLSDDVVNIFGSKGTLVVIGLSAIFLGIQTLKSIRMWWKGEITGKRCCKNVVDEFCKVGAGVVGGVAGAVLGAPLGPAGVFVLGTIAGYASSAGAGYLCDRLTQKLFGIPKSEALENAYNFFEVPMTASNHQVNTAYRKLCLKHHPDKGGKAEDFEFIQNSIGVIKAAREC